MTAPRSAEERIAAARSVVDELYGIVSAERYNDVPRWLSRLRDIRTALSDDSRPPEGRLRAAAEGVAFMYAGPRNFADFIIARDDPAEQVAVNQRLLDLMSTLRGLVRDE